MQCTFLKLVFPSIFTALFVGFIWNFRLPGTCGLLYPRVETYEPLLGNCNETALLLLRLLPTLCMPHLSYYLNHIPISCLCHLTTRELLLQPN